MLCLAWGFCETPKCEGGGFYDSFTYSWDFFLLLGCLDQPWYNNLCLLWLYLVMLFSVYIQGSPALLLREIEKGKRKEGKGEAMVRMCYVNEE